jgi:hypothetical protein
MIPVDPLTATIGFLVWMAFRKQQNTQFGVMTPEREEVFANAMQFLTDPERMNKLAEVYQKEGLKFQAFLLRKRAQWRGRPADVRLAHENIFKKAMESENIKAILEVAKAFEEMTATVKAKQLREHAANVHQAELKAAEDALAAGKAAEEVLVSKTKANGAVVNAPPIPPEQPAEPESAGVE